MENSLLEAGGIAGAQRHKPYMASGAFRGDAIRNHPLLVITRASVGKGGMDPIMLAPSSNPQEFLQFLFPRPLIPVGQNHVLCCALLKIDLMLDFIRDLYVH